MATLIPSLDSCARRMTSGELRLARRLEQKLEEDYLLWYDVPVGPKQTQPDFVLLHPRRGALILETKDWRLDTIRKVTPQYWEIFTDAGVKAVINPLAQARHCAIQVVNALERDPQLVVQAEGRHRGKLAFSWGHGVVFTRITRKQFDTAGLGEAIEPHRVICQDEMLEGVDAEAFQERLWANSLLLLYDDAQSIFERARSKNFSFKSVGVQAQGRTTILKINYRNTRQILQTANLVAADLLTADDKDDDGIPLVKPISCGREGQAPVIIKLPHPARRGLRHRRPPRQRPLGRPRLGRHGRAVRRLENHGPLRQRSSPAQAAAPRTQEEWRLPTRRGCHLGRDDESQHGVGVPGGGAAWGGEYPGDGGG